MKGRLKEEICKVLKKRLKNMGERHPRISLENIEKLELVQVSEGQTVYYGGKGNFSYYVWLDNEMEHVIDVQVIQRRRKKYR